MSAEIRNIPGVAEVDFDYGTRFFHIKFHRRFVTPENIFAAVWEAGKKMGKEYLPQIVA